MNKIRFSSTEELLKEMLATSSEKNSGEVVDLTELIEGIQALTNGVDLRLFLYQQKTGISVLSLNELAKLHPENEELQRVVQCVNRLKRISRDFPDIVRIKNLGD